MEKLEDALVSCGFGWFHVRLIVTTLVAVLATTSVTTTASYILPSAECDLHMDNVQKGLLNGIPFFGQLAASLVTGFVTDAFGRKMFLVGGNVGMFVCGVLGGCSQSYWMLVLVKFFDGVFLSLSFSAAAVLLAELTPRSVRDRVLLGYSMSMSLAIVTSAAVAWATLPHHWDFSFWNGYFRVHSWNVYLWVCSTWSLLAAILYLRLPESPKFLLSLGKEQQALDVVRAIYQENTGKPKDSMPITSLLCGAAVSGGATPSLRKQMTSSLYEIKDLFRKPLFCYLLLFCTTTVTCLLTYSSLRLWYPQLSTLIEGYQREHGAADSFCVMVSAYTRPPTEPAPHTACVPQYSGSETYTNGMVLGLVSLVLIAGSIFAVDYVGQKILMFGALLLCGLCAGALHWARSSLQVALLVAATCGLMQTAFSLQHNILVRVFPTGVRTVAMSIVIMAGRAGSLLGNVLFPVLLRAGCMVPFLSLTCVTFSVAGIVYFLPNPNTQNKGTGDK